VTRRRRRLLLLLLLLLVAGYFLLGLPQWSATLVARGLSASFGRPVSVGAVVFRLVPLEVELRELQVASLQPGDPPTIEVPRIVIAPSIAPLRGRRLVLSRVKLEEPRIRIHAFPDPPKGRGGDDIPRLGGRGGSGRWLDVSISRLVIQGGEFRLDHDRVPLDVDLPDFRGRLQGRPGGGLQGRVSFGPGPLRFGTAPELPIGTDIDLSFHRGLLTVESARLYGEGTDLAYTGRLRFSGRPQGQFNLKGPVDLRLLDKHVLRSGFGLEGATRFDGVLSVDGSRLRIEGRMEGTVGRFLGEDVPRYAGEVSYDGPSGLRLRGLDVDSLGGRGVLDVDVPPAPRPVRIRGPITAADGEGLVRLVFGWGAFGVATAATGEIDVSWPKGQTRRISGSVGLDLAAGNDGRTPLSGRFDWTAEDGAQTVKKADLRTPETRAFLEGRIDVQDRTDLAVTADSSDLAATDDLLTRLRRALGNTEAQKAGFSGEGSFQGHWRGTLDVPVFEGRSSSRNVGYRGVDWGRAEWVGSADPVEVRSHSLVVRRAGAEMWLDGRLQTGYFGQDDAMDVKLRLEDWPAADIVKAMEWEIDVTGPLSGEASVRGRRSAPEGEARVTSRDGRYYGVAYDEVVVESRWGVGTTQVTSGRASVGGGALVFRGSLTDDGVYDGEAEVTGVELDQVVTPAQPELGLHGRLTGKLLLQGTLLRPRLTGTFRSPRVFFGDEGVGALEASLRGTGDGEVDLQARCRSSRVDLVLSGKVGAVEPHEASLTLRGRDTSLDPFLRVLAPEAVPSTLGLVATGEVTLRGPARDFSRLSARATLQQVQVQLPEYVLRNREPVVFLAEEGKLSLPSMQFSGEGTELVMEGGADLVGEGPLAVTVRGDADLRALTLLSRRLRGRGAARLALTIGGTRVEPRLEGTLALEGAGLRVRGFPHGVEDVRGAIRFTEKAATLADIRGNLAGGTLEVGGEVNYAGGRLVSYDIPVTGRGLGLRYPEGLRSLLDADLRLFGDAARQWLTGTLDVKQAVWSKRYDVATELLAGRPALDVPASLEEGARLDVKLRAPGTLRIDNNLADLQARADLTIQGSTTAPVVTGRAEVDRGRIYFQGRTYVIRQGILDFVNPQKIDPLFDIEAETRIRSYRVSLRVGGTLERVTPNLTSDPPLSSVQILALLAGGDETEVANLTQAQAQANQGQLAATGAATLAAGKISEEVGLERGAERLLGLNRFSIDPSLVRGATTTPTARLNMGKRITPDLSVLYSQDLRSNDVRLISLEYTLRDWLSLLLTREDPTGGFGVDVRFRQAR
jgi:translocation and assembly module TamB